VQWEMLVHFPPCRCRMQAEDPELWGRHVCQS
jgi:hypothetical protein